MNIKFLFYILITCTLCVPVALAQDNYLPPPLFAEPREPPPRPKVLDTKMPRVSKTIEDYIEPEKDDDLIIKPRVVPAETPKVTPVKVPIPPKEKPVLVSPSNKIEIPKETPKPKKVNNNGVVKGPKVMPAVKKKNVDAEVTFENQDPPPVNIIERVQAEPTQAKSEPKPEESETSRLKTPNKQGFQNISSMRLGYDDGASELSAENKIELFSKIVPVLKADDTLKISIEAYASPQKNKMNGDRRLALARAMAIRSYLIDQGIEAQRINVRSLGSQSNISPLDRVEITLAQ